MPLVCCAPKAITPFTTGDVTAGGPLNPSLDSICRRAEERDKTLCERLRTVCCRGRQVDILEEAAGVMERVLNAETMDKAVLFLILAVREAIPMSANWSSTQDAMACLNFGGRVVRNGSWIRSGPQIVVL